MSESRQTGGDPHPDRREEFLRLLGPVYRQLENFVFAMTRDTEEARDLVAETLLRAYESFGRLKSPEAFLSYLFSIASREAGRRRRRARWFGSYSQEAAERIEWGGAPPDIGPDIEMLHRALALLPHQQREAVVLFEISGFSLREIQAIQGGTLSGVKVRIHRGRKRLARLLGVDAGLDGIVTPERGGPSRPRGAGDDYPIFFEATFKD